MTEPQTPQLDVPHFADAPALQNWLVQQAHEHGLTYLLAHADDGVIWGRFSDDSLTTSHDVDSTFPALRPTTLQQARAFGVEAEVLLWRDDAGWCARLACDGNQPIREAQMLWGDHAEKHADDGWTLLADGAQGLRHLVPLNVSDHVFDPHGGKRPVRLVVHHTIAYTDAGVAYIALSRLVDLRLDSKEKSS